jgi:microcystin-dependent protein
VTAVTNWPNTYPFFIAVDPGTAKEEKMRVTGVSTLTVTVVRGEDNTSAVAHNSGAICYPVFTATEANEANEVASVMTTKGDVITTDGSNINRLGVGTNTHVLQADSTATNGVKWGTVTATGLASDSVTTVKIANDAVTTAKILNANVTTDKIENNAVTAAKIASAVAGNGLSGGAGTAFAVNVDDSTIEINSDTLRLKDNGVTLAKLATAVQNLLVPVGTISAYPGVTAPTGWLLCDGTSTTGYTALAALVGATTPDLRGHTLVGKGSAPFDGALLSKLGSTTSTAAHSHSIGHDHGAFISGSNRQDHDHAYDVAAVGSNPIVNVEDDSTPYAFTTTGAISGTNRQAHDHSIDVPAFAGDSGPSSAGSTHGNVQPSALINYIIKHD